MATTPRPQPAPTRALLAWHRRHGRDFEWRRTRDPYRVLLAELLLQRTPYWKVAPAYERLLAVAPDPKALVGADPLVLSEILRPLGLVRRVDSLVALAQTLVYRHGGSVPQRADALLALPGVGRYTASAVQVFALGRRMPLVDGLTGRFYRRFLGLPDGREPHADEQLWRAVASVQPLRPREFHLAVIDLSSLVCRLRRPRCEECPVLRWCAAPQLPRSGTPRAAPPPWDRVHRRADHRTLTEPLPKTSGPRSPLRLRLPTKVRTPLASVTAPRNRLTQLGSTGSTSTSPHSAAEAVGRASRP